MTREPVHFTKLRAMSRNHSRSRWLQYGAFVTAICLALGITRDAGAQLRIPFDDDVAQPYQRGFRGFNAALWDRGSSFSRDNRLFAFAPKGSYMGRGTFELWDLSDERKVFTFEHPHAASDKVCLHRFDFLNDGCTLAAVFDDQSGVDQIGVMLFDIARREPRTSIKFGKHVHPQHVAVSPDGTTVVVAQSKAATRPKHHAVTPTYDVVAYDAATGSERKRLDHCALCTDVEFSPDGKVLATVHAQSFPKGEVLLWDAATLERRSALHTQAGFLNLTFSPDSQVLATAVNRDHNDAEPAPGVGLWDVESGRLRGYLPGFDEGERWSARVFPLFAPQGGFLVASCGCAPPIHNTPPRDAQIKLWNTTTGDQTLLEHCGLLLPAVKWQFVHSFVPQLAFSPDGSMLATPDFDHPGAVKFWETKYWQPIKSLSLRASANDRSVLSVVGRMEFSHDGQWFAAWGFDASAYSKGQVVIWNLSEVFEEPPASRAAAVR